jgi:molybdopterin/thiamine biosynthesis adenylyltransferase
LLTDEQTKLLTKVFAAQVKDVLSLEMTKSLAREAGLCQRFIEIFALEKGIIPDRYNRNIGSLGLDGQKKLLKSCCLVVGLGGLGGFLCEELVRIGIGKIYASDGDVFDQTNLNRQLFAAENNIGKQKSKEAQKRMKMVNSSVEFKAFDCKFLDIPEQIWNEAVLVFDCLDNIKDRLLLAGKCSQANVLFVHGAIAGWSGEVAVIWPGSHLLEQVYKTDRKGVEQKLGTPAFTAAVTASIMAAEGIKLLTAKTSKKENRILYFDLKQNIWQNVKL